MSRVRRVRRGARADDGFTLVELTIAMGLMALLVTITLTLVISSRDVFVSTDDEATGQTDVRTAVERLGKDIRSARGLDLGATASRLKLWIDYDSDYRLDADEVVIWELQPNGSGQFDVRRNADGTSTTTAETIIDQLAFCYQVDAASPCLTTPLSTVDANRVRVVRTTMRYDARLNTGSTARNLVVVERMRNVG